MLFTNKFLQLHVSCNSDVSVSFLKKPAKSGDSDRKQLSVPLSSERDRKTPALILGVGEGLFLGGEMAPLQAPLHTNFAAGHGGTSPLPQRGDEPRSLSHLRLCARRVLATITK